MYNWIFDDETYNLDKQRAIEIIGRLDDRILELMINKKEEKRKDDIACKKLIIKVLKYQYNIPTLQNEQN